MIYINEFSAETECSRVDPPGAINDRDGYIYIYRESFFSEIMNEWSTQKDSNSFVNFFIVQGFWPSSLLLYSQRFGRYVLQHSSGICRTRELSQNFELRLLFNPRGGGHIF